MKKHAALLTIIPGGLGEPDTATGRLVADLREDAQYRDELLELVRFAMPFKAQHAGKKPGFFAGYLERLAQRMDGARTFADLVLELKVEARRREVLGVEASPIESVNEGFGEITWHDPRRGEQRMPFGTLRNKWTKARKKNLGQ